MLVQPPFLDSSNSTLVHLLRQRALQQAEQQAYTFLIDGEVEGLRLSYAELDCQARAIGAVLQQHRAQGERALLLYPPGLEFIAAFFGCLYSNVIAIPAPPPDAARLKRTLPRLRAIAQDAQASLILTTSRILTLIEDICLEVPEFRAMRWLATEQISSDLAIEWQEPVISQEMLAYLQYTSGSTATPKGVMVSHGNLNHHCADISQAWRYTTDSIAATWMPYFHDYGLVDGLIQPLYSGILCFILSPLTFIKRPLRWLETISRYRVTHSQGPNFAYDHCVRRITPDQCANLDLSHWQTASNGAEPIRKTTLEQFVTAFEPFGFRWSAFYPAYGLAEATLLVSTQGQVGRPRSHTVQIDALGQNQVVEAVAGQLGVQTLVSCGRPIGKMQVIIADPQTLTQSQPNQVGEIWISDPSVAQGYWNRPQETQQTFQAYLADTGQGPFLRTGDLGFLQDGELFVTGRLKDLIIIRGRNHYPQDIELTVEQSHPALRSNCGAAFSVEIEGEERLVIAQEVERRYQKLSVDDVVGAIRQAVAEHHELEAYAVLLLKTGSIPKTSSGKIKRQACCVGFLNGSLELLANQSLNPVVALNFKQETVTTPTFDQNRTAPKTLVELHQPTNGSTGSTGTTSGSNISQERANQLIDWLRSYAGDRINSRLIDERRCIPPYVVLDLGNRGILGMQVSAAYGGIALNNLDTMRVVEQLAAIDLTLATFVCINNFLGIRPVQHYATETLRAELLPRLAQGRELAAFALTEPGAGSNPRAISAKAIADGRGSWQLQGTKIWSGSAAWAGLINVFVQRIDAEGKPNGSVGFVVPQGTPGLRMGPEALTMGMRGVVQNTLYLENASVNSANLLGSPGTGMDVAQDAMLYTRLAIAAMSIGGMKRCTQLMLRYATRRSIVTGRLLDHPLTLARFSDHTAAITALETLVTSITERLDRGDSVPVEAYIACKTAGPELFWQTVDHLVQLLGGRGYIETNIASQILRDARIFRIFEGPTETLNMFLGSRVLHQSTELHQFLCHSLEAPMVSDRLSQATEQINARWSGSTAPFCDRPTALRWASVLTGEVATFAILWATVQGAMSCTPSDPLRRAVVWTQQQFEQTLARVLNDTLINTALLNANGVTDLVTSYTAAIGDLEQTLPGEEDTLDPLLGLAETSISLNQTTSLPPPSTSIVPPARPKIVEPADPKSESQLTATSIETWIAQWLAQELKIPLDSIDTHKPLPYYGLDSVTMVSLTSDMEDWLKCQIPLILTWDYPSIKALAQHLAKRHHTLKPVVTESLVPLQPNGNRSPLFCIYGIWLYQDLAARLGSEQPVYGVYVQEEVNLLKANRLGNQAAILTNVTDLAALYLKEIQAFQPSGPYFLAGASFGGLVVFEMAQQLQAQGETVALVALFDTESPIGLRKLRWSKRAALHWKYMLREGVSYPLEKLGQRVNSVKKSLVRPTHRTVQTFDHRNQRPLENFLHGVDDVRQQVREQAARNYVPQPYPGKVILFQALNRSEFEVDAADHQRGWKQLSTGGLEVHSIPGGHINILKEPYVSVLAQKLKVCLEQAQIS